MALLKVMNLMCTTFTCNKLLIIGPPVESMNIPDDNNDHITLKHMILFETVQGSTNLLYNLSHISGCYNPSVSTFRSQLMVACRSHGNLHGPISLAWLTSSLQIDTTKSEYGIGPGFTESNEVDGEDYRLFDPQDGRLIISYTFYPNRVMAQMRIAELGLVFDDSGAEGLHVLSEYHLIPISNSTSFGQGEEEESYLKRHQKNWCPLRYENETLVIAYINPMVVVSYAPQIPDSTR